MNVHFIYNIFSVKVYIYSEYLINLLVILLFINITIQYFRSSSSKN